MQPAVARGLVEGLAEAGVTRLFGVPGGGVNLDLIGAAAAVGIDFTLTHTEVAACIAAATHGRVTGTAGVATVTRGPGVTAAANGLAQATLDRFPLVVISDAIAQADTSRVAHQRLDQVAAARPLTKWAGVAGRADPARMGSRAARLAQAGPAGAVYLSVDASVPGDEVPDVSPTPVGDPALLAHARQLVAASRRPVVIVGLDAVAHADAVRSALDGLDCPVLVTYEAKGVVPESWPTFAGLFTGASIERPLLARADLIVGVGLDPVEPMPGPWRYDAPVVLVGSYPVETAYVGAPVEVVGDHRQVLPRVLDAARPEWPSGEGGAVRREDLDRLQVGPSADGTLTPHQVVRTVQAAVGDVVLTVDAGAHMLVAMPLWQAEGAESVLISNGLATMGFSLPAAIGAALARPGERVICMTGDGGLGMVLAELETLARLALDVTVVVFNDAALSLIEIKQGEGQGGSTAVRYHPTDFAAVAQGMGVPGVAVRDVDALRRAVADPAPGPRLVDARVDPSGYRHVIAVTRG
ncbi:thiamine pyrophosphate-binding protein [Euzebya sp.]|uniref:thiamine pyrophosphate-binding protein n=1 Tax=Euzebya sp. TaxID=1971409 RepID=UPI0035136B01